MSDYAIVAVGLVVLAILATLPTGTNQNKWQEAPGYGVRIVMP